MKKIFFIAALLLINRCLAQCPFSATLINNGTNCPGTTLQVNSANTLAQIVWYNDNTIAATAIALSDTVTTVAGGNGDGATAGQLSFPQGIFIDSAGNVYVADANNHRVQKWAPGATSGVTVAGGNGPGAAANQLNAPVSVFVDAAGNVYVADYSNFRIQKWAPGATSGTTVAGGNGSGSAANQFDFPVGIFLDGAGNVYVADNNNHRVQKWAPGATSGVTVAGGNGPGTAADQLNYPEVIFVDAAGNIYIADEFNSRIQKWAPSATNGVTVAGGNGYGSAPNQLANPFGVFVDGSGNVYVTEEGNNRVQKWAPGAIFGVTVAGSNGQGSAPNQLDHPRFVFVDTSGNVYVTDVINQRVQKWTQQKSIDSTYTVTAPGNYTAVITDIYGCTVTTNAVVINPAVTAAIAITESPLTVCTNTGTHSFTANTVNQGTAPNYQWQVNGVNAGNNSPSYTAGLTPGDSISCILTSNAACVVSPVVMSNNIVIKGTPAVSLISTGNNCLGADTLFVTGADSLGKITWYNGTAPVHTDSSIIGNSITTVAGGNGPGSNPNQLSQVGGVYLDAAGNVYVADVLNNRIQKWAPGAISGVTVAGGNGPGAGPGQFNWVLDVFVDQNGDIYATDDLNSRAQKWSVGATSGTTIAGGNGQGSAANQLFRPVEVYADANGNVFIGDELNYRIQKWAPGATTGVTVAGGNGRGSAANQLDNAPGFFMDSNGTLYIADAGNNRIQKWLDGATSGITVAGGNGYGSAANQLANPIGVFIDAQGNVYVADNNNDRIQKWAPGASSGTTVAGGNGRGGANDQLHFPFSVFVDTRGDIYISDNGNQRVQKWSQQKNMDTTYVPVATGSYTAVVTNSNGCSVTTNAIVIQNRVTPSVSISASAANICQGTAVVFTALPTNQGSSPVYQWQVNGTAVGSNSTVYTASTMLPGAIVKCIMQNNATCAVSLQDTSNSIVMTVTPLTTPAVTIVASDTAICSGSTVSFSATASSAGTNPSFQWKLNGNNVGTNNRTYTTTTLMDGDIIRCQLSADPLLTCVTAAGAVSNPVQVRVSSLPAPVITVSASVNNICPGDPVIFTAAVNNAGNQPSFMWLLNSMPTGITDTFYRNSNLKNGDTVSCILTPNNAGCGTNLPLVSNNQVITVKPVPVISLPTRDTIVLPGKQVMINVSVTGAIQSFQWTPGTGLVNPNLINPVTLPVNTNTVFLLDAYSPGGCRTSATYTVSIFREINMPNAFTPNTDGLNDVFRVPANTLFLLDDLSIFNRWGVKIFNTKEITAGWDGTYKGQPCEAGAYIYMITGSDQKGKRFLKGTVMLLR